MYNVAIVEDEKDQAEQLLTCVQRYAEGKGVDIHCRRYGNANEFLEIYDSPEKYVRYDIVFMDVILPELNGMKASKLLREKDRSIEIVFVTNMAKYAVSSYSVEAADFIVKPVEYKHFEVKMDRVLRRVDANRGSIMVQTKSGVSMLRASDIAYVEVLSHTSSFHLSDGKVVSVYGALKEIESRLPSNQFVRCHNSYLVNLGYVTAVEGFTVTVCGTKLAISHPKKKEFMKALTNYFGDF